MGVPLSVPFRAVEGSYKKYHKGSYSLGFGYSRYGPDYVI